VFFSQGRMRALGFSSLEDFTTNFMGGYFGRHDQARGGAAGVSR
jgi:hypothetical protein